jgi:hypothetical protein
MHTRIDNNSPCASLLVQPLGKLCDSSIEKFIRFLLETYIALYIRESRVKDKVLEGNPVLDGDAVPGKRSDSFTCILVPHDGS